MYTTYFHADTVDVSRKFVHVEYGNEENIHLNEESSRIKLFFPIRSRNIRASLTLPEDVDLSLPEEGTLFSLENLVSSNHRNFVFETMYLNLANYIDSSGQLDVFKREILPIKKQYEAVKICCASEINDIGDSQILFNRYLGLLRQVIGKSSINSFFRYGIYFTVC